MKKAMLIAVLLFAIIIFFSNATAMIAAPVEYCLELEDIERMSSCIKKASPPKNLAICDKITQEIENYDELLLVCYQKYAKARNDSSACSKLPLEQEAIDDCYMYGLFCDKLGDADKKAECEQNKLNVEIQQSFSSVRGFIVALLYFGIPIVILWFIIKPIIDHFRKRKLTKKLIKRNVVIIIVLAVIWYVLTVTFCLAPFCYMLF